MVEKINFFLKFFYHFYYWNGRYGYTVENFKDVVSLITYLDNIYQNNPKDYFIIKNSKKIYINLYAKRLKIGMSIKEY